MDGAQREMSHSLSYSGLLFLSGNLSIDIFTFFGFTELLLFFKVVTAPYYDSTDGSYVAVLFFYFLPTDTWAETK